MSSKSLTWRSFSQLPFILIWFDLSFSFFYKSIKQTKSNSFDVPLILNDPRQWAYFLKWLKKYCFFIFHWIFLPKYHLFKKDKFFCLYCFFASLVDFYRDSSWDVIWFKNDLFFVTRIKQIIKIIQEIWQFKKRGRRSYSKYFRQNCRRGRKYPQRILSAKNKYLE